MVFEIGAILGAVAAIGPALREGKELVGSIRAGLSRRNQDVKNDLSKAMEILEERLEAVGRAALLAESYSRTLSNAEGLLSACERLRQQVDTNAAELQDWKSSGYSRWEIVQSQYRALDQEQQTVRQVLLDRADWYDPKDKGQIEGKLKDFSRAYMGAKGYVDGKQVQGVLNQVEQMIEPLRDAKVLLEDSLYEEILARLQRVGVSS